MQFEGKQCVQRCLGCFAEGVVSVRLFLALLPDTGTLDRLVSVVHHLKLVGRERLVGVANFHITLAFIGDVAEADLSRFRKLSGSKSLRRCAISFEVLEYWPKSQAVVLTTRTDSHRLAAVTEELRTAITAQVQPRNGEQPWRAHVTLARKVVQAPVLATAPPLKWVSQSVCLMSSKTGGEESVYTVVDSWPLLDKH